MSKKNVDGRSTCSHDNKKFRTRSVEKQRGMAFDFRKTATAVVKPDRQIANSTNKTKTAGTSSIIILIGIPSVMLFLQLR